MIVTKSERAATAGERFSLYRAPATHQAATFADDVRAGLSAAQKRLSPKYFYDELGSALFEAICELPEYYLTRAESEILERYSGEMLAALGEPVELVELGSGSGRKTRLLIEAALRRQDELDYHPVDISPSALIAASTGLVGAFEGLRVRAYASDYFDVLAARRVRTERRTLTLFLGSNIGNYEPPQAVALLRAVSAAFGSGDALLLGTDLKKDAAVLERAYDDPTGVTAAFDKNLLGRINRELGGTFDLRAFEHEARYDAERGVVESFLVAQRAQTVAIDALDLTVGFAQGERIHTESSYKFSASDVANVALVSGFEVARRWTDAQNRFAVSLLVVP
jgi:dimethylhistidine N-methyltransferase